MAFYDIGRFRSGRIHQLPVDKIVPNPRQPRQQFDEESLQELSESIRLHGILQPLTVQRTRDGYTLIAGERRLRAARLAGLATVPCLLVQATDEESALLALVENLHRRDLHYLEEAEAIAKLITTYGLSQEEAARRLGKSQPAIANKLRLLRLSPACRQLLRQYGLSERHARSLLRLSSDDSRLDALRHIGEKHLNVASTEAYIEDKLKEAQTVSPRRTPIYIIKDVRLLLNSISRGVETIRNAGVDAIMEQQEQDDTLVLTIRIPRKRKTG